MTRSVSTRRAVLAVLSMLIGPAGVVLLAGQERYVQVLILAGLLAAHALLEVVAYSQRYETARRRERAAQHAAAGGLLDQVVGL